MLNILNVKIVSVCVHKKKKVKNTVVESLKYSSG